MPDRVDHRVDVSAGVAPQADGPATVKVLLEHLGTELESITPEDDPGPGMQLLPRVHQGLPSIGLQAPDQQALDGAARRIAASEQPRGKHLGIVDDEEVAPAEKVGKGAHAGVGDDGAGRAIEDEQPRRLTVGGRLLRDALGWEMKIEQGHVHEGQCTPAGGWQLTAGSWQWRWNV